MDRLRQIELFISAAQAGSFSKAARLLQLDPSAVSHAIAELERHLAFKLFHRTTRQLSLTEEGEEVIRHGRSMLSELEELESIAHTGQSLLKGLLRVGMSVSVSRHVVMPRLPEFMRRHPALRLECLLLTQAKDLHAAGLDVMFQSGASADSDLVARRIATLRLGVYASPSYLAQAGEPKTPDDLVRHACLVHKPSFTTRGWDNWEFQRGAESCTVKVPSALMTDDREGLLEAALAGGGIVRIGMFSPTFLATGRLRRLLADWQCPGGPAMNVLYRKSARTNPKIAAFLGFLDEVFADFDPDEVTLSRNSP